MMKRKRVPNKKGRKMFTKTADRVHRFNMQTSPMRGGIRM